MLDGLMRCVESGGYPISRGEVSVIRKRISLGIDPKKVPKTYSICVLHTFLLLYCKFKF